ncbi:hypothetical protein [Halobellus limi]|jgi:hypothetical protein|uniref:Uncharacterized protein n=1 Tax=Halobellus limi TaxID=699433 RepID=A0A1H6B9W0_9EURY|nr:hypothetical protein [Halobellus limi]QCC49216.1 hypothetical protein DV707_15810 [Halobellus limi]SEG57538.1 hypothetical protein SAMN04488133_2688 [Halobellus limi]
MLRQAREFGPVFLIPLAWIVVIATHLDLIADATLFIAHVAMSVLLAVFVVTGRAEMRTGTLRVWWRIIAVGFVVTLLGAAGFRTGTVGTPLQALALFGWMALPAVGFVDVARRKTEPAGVYVGCAVTSLLGAVVYAGSVLVGASWVPVVGLALVGLGQTVAIADAAFRY